MAVLSCLVAFSTVVCYSRLHAKQLDKHRMAVHHGTRTYDVLARATSRQQHAPHAPAAEQPAKCTPAVLPNAIH